MANWMTVAEISARYIVGEHKLFDYARRGNMPMLRRADGVTLFDESYAAQIFRPRGAATAITAPANGKPNMGVLGMSLLGERATSRQRTPEQSAPEQVAPVQVAPVQSVPEPSVRRAHRRALRFAAQDEAPARKAVG